MEVTKYDKLFALKALKRKVDDEYKLVEGECRETLLAEYDKDGTDRKTSKFFGPEAGKFSIKRTGGCEAHVDQDFTLDDDEKFVEWLEGNKDAAVRYAILNAPDFGRYWLNWSGELPDGITLEEIEVPAQPPTLSAQVYSFKPDVVIGKLGGNLFEEVDRLLLGDGND